MNKSVQESVVLERISEEESVLLRERLQVAESPEPTSPSDATTVAAVAEATGRSVDEVRIQLRRIRAEEALAVVEPRRSSRLIPIAEALLIVGAVVALLRSQGLLSHPLPPRTVDSLGKAESARPSTTVSHLPAEYLLKGAGAAPGGFRVDVVSNGYELVDNGQELASFPMPYEFISARLSESAGALIAKASHKTGTARNHTLGMIEDQSTSRFSLTDSQSSITLSGWPGRENVIVESTLDRSSQTKLDQSVRKFLEEKRAQQEQSLNGRVDSQGILPPPPGFTVDFAGYRADSQSGPRILFAPIAEKLIAERLTQSILNAMMRDRIAATGPKGRLPAEARVSIRIPGRTLDFDVPETNPSDASRIIRVKAAEAAKFIAPINEKASGLLSHGKSKD